MNENTDDLLRILSAIDSKAVPKMKRVVEVLFKSAAS